MRKSIPVLACLCLLLAGCGGGSAERAASAAEVWAKFGKMTPAEREPELARLAKEEGGLVYYAGWTYSDEHGKAFAAKYGIQVDVFHADNETVEQRARQERDANRSQVDVLELEYLAASQFSKEGFFYTDWTPNLNGQEQADPGWFTVRNVAYVVGWNTQKVAPGEEPRSLEDLADPKWKGQIGLEIGDLSWYVGLSKYFAEQGRSPEELTDVMMRIAANSRQAKGHTAMATSLASGEYAILPSAYNQSIDLIAEKGGPAAWKTADGGAVEPIVLVPEGIGLAKDAQHPAAAMLFADFLASEEGQKIYADNAAVPVLENLSPVAQYETISTSPPPPELLTSRKYQDEYERILASTGT